MPVGSAAVKKNSVLHGAVRKKSSRATASLSGTLTAAGISTTAADVNARQVTRAEFMELSAVVAQLRKDLYRLQSVESQLASDLEFVIAQVTANKGALGSLAESVVEKEADVEQQLESHFRDLRIETGQKLTDAQLSLERLEFRFKHHVRDCRALVDQLEREQELGRALKEQLAQLQVQIDKQREQQLSLVESVQFAITTTEDKVLENATSQSGKVDALQQRIASFIKKFDKDSQDSINAVTRQLRDLELREKRQGALIHQALDDIVGLRQATSELHVLGSAVERDREEFGRQHSEVVDHLRRTDVKLSDIISLVEEGVDRSELQRVVDRLESSVKLRVEAVLEMVALCVDSVRERQP